MNNDITLLNLVLKHSAELGITGYDIAQNTSISAPAAYKILNGQTKNPRRKNLLEILDYIEDRLLKVGQASGREPRKVAEPETEYQKQTRMEYIFGQYLEKEQEVKKLQQEVDYLKKLLDKNNISY